MRLRSLLSLALLAASSALAQAFPDGATAPTAEALTQHLGERAFKIALADGHSWRLEFSRRGHFFINTLGGFNGRGSWRTEDGKVCTIPPGQAETCNDVRMQDGQMYMKRLSGEIIKYLPH